MFDSKKHIDDLIRDQGRKKAELDAIDEKIASSAKPTVVAFVDLADSTQLKWQCDPKEWLRYVYDFIQFIGDRSTSVGGTLVKRIGDELMLTFLDVESSERFFVSLASEPALEAVRYKIGVDFGDAFHFRFLPSLPDDPYGQVVDRCARVAKYASAGTILCTEDYRRQLNDPTPYTAMGEFPLRGLPRPTALFLRSLTEVDVQKYLEPIMQTVNQASAGFEGFRFVARKLTTHFIREFGEAKVRPFLARELLNVPKVPYSPNEFQKITGGPGNDENEQAFFGYLVEWEGTVEGFKRGSHELTLRLQIGSFPNYWEVRLLLPLTYLELVRLLPKGRRLRARGVIDDIFAGVITLNYVDIDVVE